MKVYSDLYASIESHELLKLLEGDENLLAFVQSETDRAKDENAKGACLSCGRGQCRGCMQNYNKEDAVSLTSALISIFNYYIPDNIKEAIHLQSSTYLGSENEIAKPKR